ncbi:hypothetical protein GCM10007978_01590 [Shewanella hanedai]|uniref:Uncharacterized protein n=1 Tax=Shewanella hanedai TaxID=25 RepID=A0A553JUZ5_SHEHA|nr:hypothetical protein [Shewanella hanedai]TRY16271.1 hypothetical protein FN961_01185 [Shewanella hanedai]GGI67609.1 hypothetical protein GCM10007978_01590 [Shewanella hanedai]
MTVNRLWKLKKYRDNRRINFELQNLKSFIEIKEQKLMTLCIQQKLLGADHEIKDHASLQIAAVNLAWLEGVEKNINVLQEELIGLNLSKVDKEKSLHLLEHVIDEIDKLIDREDKVVCRNDLKVKDKQVQSWLCESLARRLYD